MTRSVLFILLNLLALTLGTLVINQTSSTGAAESKPGWEAEWKRTLEAARQEKEVTFLTARDYDVIFSQFFHKKYPEIKPIAVTNANLAGFAPRIVTERRAGKYLWDLYLGSASTGYINLYKTNTLEPIPPNLILPEVVDESNWLGGKHEYVDKEKEYLFVSNGVLQSYFFYNRTLVDPKELNSFWDLLSPKWRGKIAIYDPTQPGVENPLRFLYYHPELGPKFLRRLLTEMDVTMSRDRRQLVDWLGSGKYAIAFSAGLSDIVDTAKKQGLPVNWFSPKAFKEGTAVGGGSGTIGLINKAPHPNAARVAINWLLSREGQIAYQRVSKSSDSRRTDIPKDMVSADVRRVEGVKYMIPEKAEWMDMEPITRFIQEVLREKK